MSTPIHTPRKVEKGGGLHPSRINPHENGSSNNALTCINTNTRCNRGREQIHPGVEASTFLHPSAPPMDSPDRKVGTMDPIVQILLDHRGEVSSYYFLTRRCQCGEVVIKSRDRDEVRQAQAEHQASLIRQALISQTLEGRQY